MYTVTKYPHGAFNWAQVNSTDAETSKSFYMDMFGWGKVEIPMGDDFSYTMFQHQGEYVAAHASMMPEMQAAGMPSHWTNFVTVDDVDALIDVVKANGGTIIFGPVDVMDNGRLLGLQDPTGAQLFLWQPQNHIGAGIVNTVGAMCWNELLTRDAETAKTFYSKLLGWEYCGDEHYIHIRNRGRNNGGMMKMDENFGEMPPMWMVYFHVEDIDAAMKRVEELGGRVVTQKMEAPDTGWFTVIEDPTDAVFYIMQLAKVDPWEE
jgi:predicted enzyme related to lactoylglutathione lyase